MTDAKYRFGVFVSYSHADRKWLDRLRTHLEPYLRGERFEFWDDRVIKPGARWDDEIERAMARARVAVLLVTPDFLASDYIARVELPAILRRANSDLTIVWIPVRPSAFEITPLNSIQAVHDPHRPLASLPMLSRMKRSWRSRSISRQPST